MASITLNPIQDVVTSRLYTGQCRTLGASACRQESTQDYTSVESSVLLPEYLGFDVIAECICILQKVCNTSAK